MTLTEQFKRIEDDILLVLSKHESLTQSELYSLRGDQLKNISEYGWSFAIDNLEKRHEIECYAPHLMGNLQWQLKNPERRAFIKEVEEFTSKKLFHDL